MKEVCHYSQMQVFATSSYQKNYFQQQINTTVDGLVKFLQLYFGNGNKRRQPYAMQQEQGQMEPAPDENMLFPDDILADLGQLEEPEEPEDQRVFTLEELSGYDGRDGRPAYVAVDGIVYDVSNVMRWAGGTHFGLVAGQDHTSDFMLCHDGMQERLNSLPVVGILG
ncbi:MAG TPA: hypothetical protein GXX75_09930 [Clostridiales bacterium]|nr:hypothetical protein [Clostridiales bacterium]